MGLLLKKCVSLLIIGELILTGLGYCGHDHDHGFHQDFTYESMHIEKCAGDHHESPHSHHHMGRDNDCKKCHCSCLGGFLAEINPVGYRVIHSLAIFEPESPALYYYRYIPFVYHPPIPLT